MNKPAGTSTPTKPATIWRRSPNFSSRNGVTIRRVILHYTTAAEAEGSLSWFANPASQVSAHYVIDKNGDIYQCVRDADKAWHAYGENADSIGIEHVARKGERLTSAQSNASAALCRWLLAEYHLEPEAITAHRFTASNKGRTDCPGDLWRTEQELREWVKANVVPPAKGDEPVPDEPKGTGRPYAPCPVPVPWMVTLARKGSLDNPYSYFSQGGEVYHLQCALIGLGYLAKPKDGELVGDVFNEHVDFAVRRLQNDEDLEIDGIVGPKTRATLEAALTKARAPKPADPKPTDPKPVPAGKPVRCVFSLDLEPSQALRAGTLSFLDAQGKVVRKEPATSGLPGYQTLANLWTRGAGPVPSVPNQAIRFSDGYALATPGIEGWAFPMLPDPILRNGAVGRAEIMLHRDANVPGTAGCIGLLLGKAAYDDFVAWAKPLGTLPLEVRYS